MEDLLKSKQPPKKSSTSGIWGVSINGVFWYWKKELSTGGISRRKAKKWANGLINIASALALAGAVLGYGWLSISGGQNELANLSWSMPTPRVSLLWIAIALACFLFYRAFQKKTGYIKMPTPAEGAVIKPVSIPSIDVVEKKKNIIRLLSEDGIKSVESAFALAKQSGHARTLPIHLFSGALESSAVAGLFMRLGISFNDLKEPIKRRLTESPQGSTVFGADAQQVIACALSDALASKRRRVGAIDIIYCAYKADDFIKELLFDLKIEEEDMKYCVEWVRIQDRLKERYEDSRHAAAFKATGTMNKAYTSVATPFLDSVSEDLTVKAVKGGIPMLIGRESEIEQIMRAIEGGNKSVVLVGESGTGKGAIIGGIAELMAEERVPEILKDKRLIRISIPHIASASGGQGAEERLLYTMQEVGRSGNIVLIIDSLEQVADGSHGADLSAALASELEKGYTFVIATTTPEAYTKSIERGVIGKTFEKIIVEEPSHENAIYVLQSRVGGIEHQNNVVFTYESLRAIVEFSDRYMHESFLPEKAMLLAKEVAHDVAKRGQEWARIAKQDVATIINQKTHVKVTDVTEDEGEKMLNLEAKIHERVIGQDEAVGAIAAALRRARVELRSEKRPIANFLFLGPTGVGKTATAKATAEVYFGDEESMLRFDMSEYQDKASIERLIGSAGEPGQLTEAVRKNPFALVLLDELEKAHSDILNLFLQVMDDGRLTDGLGHTIDFTNVILIATSNAGTSYIQDEVSKGTPSETIKQHLMEQELKEVYRPEFLNRFDGIVVFKPLTQENIIAIARIMIKKVTKRLEEKGIDFKASEPAVIELAKKGYDPKFGARPLRRVVQETIENAIAEEILGGKVERRDAIILQEGGGITIEKAPEL